MSAVDRFMIRIALTLVLWGVIWSVWYAITPPGGLWWVCLLIAAGVVFLGEVFIRTGGGRGDGDWDIL